MWIASLHGIGGLEGQVAIALDLQAEGRELEPHSGRDNCQIISTPSSF